MQQRQFHASVQTDGANSSTHVSDPQVNNTNMIDDLDTTCIEQDVDVLEFKEKELKAE